MNPDNLPRNTYPDPFRITPEERIAKAAPDLLRALRDLVSMYERGYVVGQNGRTGAAFLDGVDAARAAIATATGGQP